MAIEIKGTWRHFDLDVLPPVGARIRLERGAGMFTGTEARFLCVAESVMDRHGKIDGPWVIGWLNDGRRPLLYLPTAWDWFDEGK